MDLTGYHDSPLERERVGVLMQMLPSRCSSVLDIGCRDGFITRQLADRIAQVTALDLQLPRIDDPRIHCMSGNAAELPFPDGSFDLVFCAEVIEHIPSPALERACHEMARVSRQHVLIGVPYRQDLRQGRTTCSHCGGISPPWGHVNTFDEARLNSLFAPMRPLRTEYVGQAEPGTNALSAWLMDVAGNPWGTYSQEERCVHCNGMLAAPRVRNLLQRGCTRLASLTRQVQVRFNVPHANWIHVLFGKDTSR